MAENENFGSRAVDLSSAISAFPRLACEARSDDPRCFASLFLAETANLLSEIQGGRIVDDAEWLEAARFVSQMDGGPHV